MRVLPVLFAAFVIGAADDPAPDQTLLDLFLNGLSIVLIALPLWDWRVALRLRAASNMKPSIPALTTSYHASLAVAIAATIAGVLGMNRIYSFFSHTTGFLPVWLSLGMLAAALIIVSLPNIPREQFLRRITRAPVVVYHHREGDLPHPHRRWDDPVEGGPDGDGLSPAGPDRPHLRDPRIGQVP